MSKNWRASEENETAHKFLKDNSANIKEGDTIEFEPNNQTGYVKYKVILNGKGEKDLEKIASYDSMSDDDEDETKSGGKRRRRRKTKRAKKSKRKRKTRRGKKR